MQIVIVWVLFIAALGYMVRVLYKLFTTTKGCASNCGKCKVDFDIPPKKS
jgi:hypothetical protein